MSEEELHPLATGPTRRRRRLSDEETARRVLDAALAMVHRSGLTVGLDHISFEDVIREAGVSRTAAYRRWPYKDLFFGDLLRALASGAAPAAAVSAETSRALIASVVADRSGDLSSPEGRRDLVSELIRLGAASDQQAIRESPEWRTYLALQATFLSLPLGALRDEIHAALGRSEQGFVDRIAQGWQSLAELLGFRLRPESGGDYTVIATLASGQVRGLALMELSHPDLVNRRSTGNPTGASTAADWSLAGLGAASIAMTFLEPDPDVVWDDARLAELRQLLEGVPMIERAPDSAPRSD
ncbi:TetR/AcrR family transcriptional regulator [Cryptosporangium minutisporangium]|uniref:HTH tetR-type domain-containing protein n=1 Tax=Cryptosporangium minutisporangium TaxID=113569 RepID=A0ABP6T879_9ACTN